jgi:hypothetical protein
MLCTLCAHMFDQEASATAATIFVKVSNGWFEARSLRQVVDVLCFCRMCCLLGLLHMLCRSCLSLGDPLHDVFRCPVDFPMDTCAACSLHVQVGLGPVAGMPGHVGIRL